MKNLGFSLLIIFFFTGCANAIPIKPTKGSSSTPTIPKLIPTPMVKDPYGNYISWGEIPSMPGTISGYLQERKYYFQIRVKPTEVKSFYENELIKHGWKTSQYTPEPNASSGPENQLVFMLIGWDHQLLYFTIKYIDEISYAEIDFNTYGSYY